MFTFSESVRYFNKYGIKVYCAFLDVSKAFDKVLINGLIKKLIDRNVPYEPVSILYTWFRCLSCCVSWNSLVSPPLFPILCGVRQGGGILSPFLFAIYLDDLIAHFRKYGYGR